MQPEELSYDNLKHLISNFENKGRSEARSFLNWFLENIFRLDAIEADDCICDKPNDRGIDGIFVDHNQNEVIIFQGKIRQKESSIGDAPLRELAGTITQVENADAIEGLLEGGGNEDLKNLLVRLKIRELIENDFTVIGAFVSNQPLDQNGREFADSHGRIRVFDRLRISGEYIDIQAEGGVDGDFSFDTSYVAPLELQTGSGVCSFILPVQALELVKMSGIEDGKLFSQNVRQSLGNTKVNRAMRESVNDKGQHQYFPLYHNGVTILCGKAKLEADTLKISNYVVVNGAQSISTFKRVEGSLSEDLRVIAKIIELNDSELAKAITVNSNNQNAIRSRDLKSTNAVQIRLAREFEKTFEGKFDLEIKRGQDCRDDAEVITNEEAGKLLLAFDLLEPEACHLVSKLFEDKYSDIFARPAVTASRIILLHLIMQRIHYEIDGIEYKALSKYGLTRFFLLSVLRKILQIDDGATDVVKNPEKIISSETLEPLLEAISTTLKSIIIDLNYEIKDRGDTFDYKDELKNSSKVAELRSELLKSYEKELAKSKISPISSSLES
ncbi:hypothetical protein DS901_09790 [Loktanella sp. D2R18]|uniref:AIPR family protein n=1 Tax=Rhodobacterales TaxID=204455 RepID=UPI000DE9A484|nr:MULTISPECIES: AIPR family protein [Rhodobacterales]MDO6591444.1 AIPR family protein [Yoonia sp. 1_MG-2023]RBW43491.1 hypothetical protein DS901_09790 [Loktanella sp. D2R18]